MRRIRLNRRIDGRQRMIEPFVNRIVAVKMHKSTHGSDVSVWSGVIIYVVSMLSIKVSTAQDGLVPNCPSKCKCFYVFPNELEKPTTYWPLTSIHEDRYALLAASCQRQQLTLVPKELPAATAILQLGYNQLKHVDRDAFGGLTQLKMIDLSHNNIKRIDNSTFDAMKFLEHLDISYNNMTRFPSGFLNAWFRQTVSEPSILQLRIAKNPLHCDCALREFFATNVCSDGRSCIEFLEVLGSLGECNSPERIKGTSLPQLLSKGFQHKLCRTGTHIDVPMLVTMFTWFGGIIVYLLYFVQWNRMEMAKQTSYLASLDKGDVNKNPENVDSESREPKAKGSDRPYVQTSDNSLERKSKHQHKYAVTRQADTMPERQKPDQRKIHRHCSSTPATLQKENRQEEVFRMSSL